MTLVLDNHIFYLHFSKYTTKEKLKRHIMLEHASGILTDDDVTALFAKYELRSA